VRIAYTYEGKDAVFERPVTEVVVGRPKPGIRVDLDLTPDQKVSRPHARVWLENGECWIEDLGSGHGTQVASVEIKGKGKQRLRPGDPVRLGSTVLRVEAVAPLDPTATAPLQVSAPTPAPLDVTVRLDATTPGFAPPDVAAAAAGRLALLYELPLQFGSETRLDALLETIVDRVVKLVRGAESGSLLVKERSSGRLLLKAGDPSVSVKLAQQAMDRHEALVWRRGPVDLSESQTRLDSGMYAPLLWKGEALGVLAVSNCETCPEYTPDDLRLMMAVAQQAAMAIVHNRMQEDLRRNTVVLEHLLRNFSPRVRDHLLAQVRHGRLRLGGQKSEVTILVSDIRGFTRMTEGMEADHVVDLLNEYFSALIDVIFQHDGTIDKFVGDSILAVFGSPEPDSEQHEKAVRAALGMQEAARAVSAARVARRQVACEMGIGVHCGEVLHGFIGSTERIEFTVIGDAVNRAARYCDGAKPGEVLVSPELYQRVWQMVQTDKTSIETKHEGSFVAYRVKSIPAPRTG
jgi:adenylate cyclase